MNLDKLRKLPGYAKGVVFIYVLLMYLVLLWGGGVAAWHQGVFRSDNKVTIGDQDSIKVEDENSDDDNKKKSSYAEDHRGAFGEQKKSEFEEDGDSSAVFIEDGEGETDETEEANSNSNVVKTPWFEIDNLKMGHAHINGQALLFFTLIFILLFTSAGASMKFTLSAIQGVAILGHALGLTFIHKNGFKVILMISGGLLGLSTVAITGLIVLDLLKKEP